MIKLGDIIRPKFGGGNFVVTSIHSSGETLFAKRNIKNGIVLMFFVSEVNIIKTFKKRIG